MNNPVLCKNKPSLNVFRTTLKTLVVTVGTLMAMSTSQADVAKKNIGDLELYQTASGGNINLTMMLDTSGSMGISSLVLPSDNQYGSPGDVTTSLCQSKSNTETGGNVSNPTFNEWAYNAKDSSTGQTAFKRTVTVNGQSIDYYLRGCSAPNSTFPSIDASGNLLESDTGKFDRLSRMKQALISLILSDKIPANVALGLGNFSARTPLTIGTTSIKLVDGHSGTILVPAGLLTPAQKEKLIRAIAQFKSVDNFTNEDGTANSARIATTTNPPDEYKASSGTPTAHAYAEVAAYMMGTTTGSQTDVSSVSLVYDGYAVLKDNTYIPGKQTYWVCDTLGTGTTTGPGGTTVYQCDNSWPIIDNATNKYVTDIGYDNDGTRSNRTTRVYNQDGVLQTTYPSATITRDAKNIWKILDEFPVGWRFGGWRKVANEPMDIEPVTGKAWTSPARGDSNIDTGGYGLFAYRTSPFSLTTRTETTPTTSTTQGFKGCPSGTTLITNWKSLCTVNSVTASNPITRRATRTENYNQKCSAPADNSTIPMPNARKPDGTLNNNEQYNLTNTKYNSDRMMCIQSSQAVNNPWGDITTTSTTTTTTPIDNLVGGFTYSAADTKNGSNYIRGATATTSSSAQCDSNGIYFLTDGAPNSTKNEMAKTIMNTSLTPVSGTATTSYTISSTPTTGLISPAITSNLFPGETGGWEWIGEYAKRLNDPSKNPSGVRIRTAVAGFGSSFAGIGKNLDGTYNCDLAPNSDAKNACKWGKKGEGYGEGGFFYTQSADDVSSSIRTFIESLNNSIPASPSGTVTVPKDPYTTFGELPYAFLPSLEAQISNDTNLNNIWPGNVKKYSLNDGTLYGQGASALFINLNGDLNDNTRDLWQNSDNYRVTDNITGTLETKNSAVKAGGIYQNLAAPSDASASRTIYVEDLTAAGATSTTLRALSVNASGVSSGFNDLTDTTVAYTRANQLKLLQFMGYTSATGGSPAVTKSLDAWANDAATSTVAVSSLTLVAPTEPMKVLGASIHSKPVAVSYGATLLKGRVQSTGREDYVLFGSMDGTLHLVNADNYTATGNGGKEKLAIIPRTMMINQVDALVPNSKYTASTGRPASVPYFGIDGSWLVNSKYTYNYTANKVTATEVYAYGGMRLGGKGLLGYNLTDNTAPTVAFTGLNKSLIDEGTTGFDRIGYIWSQPTPIKVRTSDSDTTGVDALVFGGGYDKCYENEYFQADSIDVANITDATCKTTDGTKTKAQADGNAVYIINAKTGDLLWSATYDATGGNGSGVNNSTVFDGKKYMKHSIVGAVTVLDRDGDGIMDQIYFGDLGGQVFRADFQNGVVGNGVTNNTNGRILRILRDNNEGTSLARRFYERPNVSAYHNNEKPFMLVNVISGDRSSPLSKMRATATSTPAQIEANADRLYGIIDTDISLPDNTFYASTVQEGFPAIKNLVVNADTTAKSNNDFVKLGEQLSATRTSDTITAPMKNYTKRGWYYPLTKFDGYTNVKYNKGMGKSEIIGKQLFTMVFNPDMNYSNANNCTAKIVGGSERETYCLPWGVCDNNSKLSDGTVRYTNGTGGYERAGQGIQEINFGPQSADQLNQRIMIGTLSMTSMLNPNNRTGFTPTGGDSNDGKHVSTGTTGESAIGLKDQGTGTATSPSADSKGSADSTGSWLSKDPGSNTAAKPIFLQRYILTPKSWYEQN